MFHQNLDNLNQRIASAAHSAGREPSAITLIAVSKTFAAADIVPVIEAGQLVFGENRVQEAKAKWPDLKQRWPGIELHLIGPLQSNKAGEAVALFDAIHSIDRPKIAQAIVAEMKKQQRSLQLFIQINTGREAQKAGIDPEMADEFIATCRGTYGLTIAGLMCLPPLDNEPLPHFELLRTLAARNGLSSLSMGMSGDFEAAISCGATHVRVGSAIFGGRTQG